MALGDFIPDGGTLYTDKVALQSLPEGASATNYTRAVDLQAIKHGMLDLRTHTEGWVNVKSYGATGDGTTDDTAAIQAALADSQNVYAPSGRFVVDTLELGPGQRLVGSGWPVVDFSTYEWGTGGTVLVSRDGDDVIRLGPVSGGAWTGGTEVAHLTIDGGNGDHGVRSGTGNGIAQYQLFGWVHLHNLLIRGMGGRGIYMPEQWHTTIEEVTVDNCGDHLIEILGGNSTVLKRVYARRVPTAGKAGYRIYQGLPTLIAANGIDASSTGQAFWGIFGRSTATSPVSISPTTDAVESTFEGTLIGCNVEAFKDTGIVYRNGGGNILSTSFVTWTSGTAHRALYYEQDASGGGYIDGATRFWTAGTGAYSNSLPIHTNGVQPPLYLGNRTSQFWTTAGNTLKRIYHDGPGVEVGSSLIATGQVRGASGLNAGGSTGPDFTTGSGVPSASKPNGSVYQRTDGTGPNLYVRENGAWVAK